MRRTIHFCAILLLILTVALVGGCKKSQPASTSSNVVPYAMTAAQTPLPGSAIPQFVDPLPNLNTIIAGKKPSTWK